MRFQLIAVVAAIPLIQALPVEASPISFTPDVLSQLISPGGSVVFSGTVTNASGIELAASDFSFNFSGYNPFLLQFDQLLGLSDFLIPNNTTSADVLLFKVTASSNLILGQTYPFLVGLFDVNNDLGNSFTFSVQAESSAPVPEPSTLLLVGSAVSTLLIRRRRR